MDLRERLDGYEVTAVPHAPSTLSLVWAEPEEGVDVDDGPTFGVLALLDDYRITRVPARAAS